MKNSKEHVVTNISSQLMLPQVFSGFQANGNCLKKLIKRN